MKRMKDTQQETRKTNWKWRVEQEMEEKRHWHPFFITLTLDHTKVEKYYESTEAFWKEGKEFRKWIRDLAELSASLEGHPPPRKKTKEFGYRPESDYVTYVCILEHGKSREHHHAHAIVWIKNIPGSWKDCPNRYIRDPAKRVKRICKPLSVMWPWSAYDTETGDYLSPAYYFRTNSDIWESYGHCTPIDKKTRKPVYLGGSRQAAAYLMKYLQKDHKQWKHRVKATRNLGMMKLKEVIKSLPMAVTEALSWRPNSYNQHHLVSMTHSVPLGLVRQTAKRQHFSNCLEQNLLDFQSLMITNTGSFTRMLKSVKRGARPDKMRFQDCYDWVCQFLPVQKGYSETLQLAANECLREYFPRNIYRETNKLGANNIEPA
jgi:hypothetical protein